jgi:MoaA/NifB/PqqE/SkfB family radical SAM enzyme
MVRSLTPNRPYHVQWLLTRKCNYRCVGCEVWRQQDARELSTNEVKKGLDILKELGTLEVVLSGGNPLLRDDIEEIIEYASRSFITTVYDNGSMALKKLNALRKADFVAISVDSLNPQKNDYLRGVKNAWLNATKTVRILHGKGIPVGVSPTISKYNINEILELTDYFLNMNVPIWYCLYSYDSSGDKNQLFKIGKKNDNFAIDQREAMIRLCDSIMQLKSRNNNVLITTKILRTMRDLYSTGIRTWKCRALQNFFVIDHLGRVAGCHLHEPLVSIFDLPKAWNSEKFESLRQDYRKCERCTYLCYLFYSVHGTVLGNLQLAQDRWRSAALFLRKAKASSPDSAKNRELTQFPSA